MMSVRAIQWWLALVFFVLGGWCLLAPALVLMLTIRPEYHADAPIVPLLVRCFGAQAVLAGIFAAFSRFERRTFLAFGVALLPFFVFDYRAYAVVPILTPLGLLDAVGNVVMLGLCVAGYRAARADTGAAATALLGLSHMASRRPSRETVPGRRAISRSGHQRPGGVLLGCQDELGCQQCLLLVLRDLRALDDVGDELRAERQIDLAAIQVAGAFPVHHE
jgi:hypothetical protein